MRHFYSQSFDTNLVRTFLAVWDTGSLTIASDRLGLTQPAVSHALKRLRERFDDPLFIRGPQGMVPTDKAMQLHEPFRAAYNLIGKAIEDTRKFDPATASRQFRIAMSDVSEVYFLPPLLSWLKGAAPHVTIESVPLRAREIERSMRHGEIDLAIGHIPQLEEECSSELLFRDRLVCLLSSGHPIPDAELNAEAFSRLRQIDVGENAPSHAVIDRALARLGLKRNVVLKINHLLATPQLVRETDLAAIFPESLAMTLNRNGDFRMLPLGFDAFEIEVRLHVHRSMNRDEAIGWLMGNLRKLCFKPE